ncbi:MAG: ribonuclease HII [Pseudomonadota bacterium]
MRTAGVDEAGRGPLAGPVVAAAVILCDEEIAGVDDSKKLTAGRRAELETQIRETCIVGVGIAEPDEIDRINILQATLVAMRRAVEALDIAPEHILVDGNKLPDWPYAANAVVGGDAIHPCISAASIIAKETRDRMMRAAALDHPQYGWDSNKGYPTRAHLDALREHGPCDLHRRSFAPVAQSLLDL